MSPPLIETVDVVKHYRLGAHVVPALRGVSVTIQAGEFVAVVGASGSGKSTFLNVLGCLDGPTAGAYRLEGRDVSALTSDEQADVRSRKMGFVFQTFNLLPRMTALGNVELPLVYGGGPAPERRARARAALAAVGLADREHHRPAELSGGQQQRVGIARALVNDPVVVLADEPTGNLDSGTGREVLALFGELHRRGITIVLVTHDMEVAGHAGRVLTFRDGLIVADERMAFAGGVAAP